MNVFYKNYKKTEGDAGKVNLWGKAKKLLDDQVGYLEKHSNSNWTAKPPMPDTGITRNIPVT